MKNSLIVILSVIVICVVSCASEEGVVKKDVVDPSLLISTQNDQLTRLPIGGFDYKSSKLPSQEW